MSQSSLWNKIEKYKDLSLKSFKDSRLEAQEAFEYNRGNQLPLDVVSELERRGQPIQWENVYQEIGNKIAGLKMLSKQEIQVLSRKVDESETARTLSDILHAFQDSSEWWDEKNGADNDLRIAGMCAIEVKMIELDEFDSNGESLKDIVYVHRPILEILIDPYSQRSDFSDARFVIHTKLVDAIALSANIQDETIKKKIKNEANKEDMIRIYRTYYKDENNNIRYALSIENFILEDIQSPYTNLKRFPIAVRRLNHNRSHIEFYGLFRNVKPLQDRINFTMLRVMNMLSSKKILIETDAVDDIETFSYQYSQDNTVMSFRPNALKDKKFQDITHQNNIPALMNIIQDARAKAKTIIGVNDELLGLAVARLSGDAIEKRENQGLAGLQFFLEASGEVDKDLAEISIKIIQEHFTAEQAISMRDSFGKMKNLTINEIERDQNGAMQFEDRDNTRVPKQKKLSSTGRFSIFIQRVPISRGATGERARSWTEILKLLQVTNPMIIPKILPLILRDTESPVANEISEILKQFEEESRKNNEMIQGGEYIVK